MIIINERWAFSVDSNKNHMPYLTKTVKKKDKPAEQQRVHTGTFHPNPVSVLQYMIEMDTLEKGLGEDISLKEYLDMAKEVTVNLMKDFKEATEGGNK